MSFIPFAEASVVVQYHAIAAMLALVLGVPLLIMRKGSKVHRIIGWIWVVQMIEAAVTSFFITGLQMFGPYSFIHLLSAWALVSLFLNIRAIRRGDVIGHAKGMKGLYYGGVVLAGMLTLMPGRIFHRIIFGTDTTEGFIAAVALVVGLIAAVKLRNHHRSLLGTARG